jgi:hypothetical protein
LYRHHLSSILREFLQYCFVFDRQVRENSGTSRWVCGLKAFPVPCAAQDSLGIEGVHTMRSAQQTPCTRSIPCHRPPHSSWPSWAALRFCPRGRVQISANIRPGRDIVHTTARALLGQRWCVMRPSWLVVLPLLPVQLIPISTGGASRRPIRRAAVVPMTHGCTGFLRARAAWPSSFPPLARARPSTTRRNPPVCHGSMHPVACS